MIIERRMKYLKAVREKIKQEIKGDPKKDFRKLMMVHEDTPQEEIADAFFGKARQHPYFKDLYHEIKHSIKGRATWNDFKKLEIIGGTDDTEHYSMTGMLKQTQSIIDNNFAPLLQNLSVFPIVYTSGEYPEGFGMEPNCMSINGQIIPVLYSYDNGLGELEVLGVYSSKRVKNLLDELNRVYEQPADLSIGYYDFVELDVDTFSGSFLKEDALNMLFNQIVFLEENSHMSLRNKKTTEIYDFPIEKENFQKVESYGVRDGINLFTYLNSLLLLDRLGVEKKGLEKEFIELEEKNPENIFVLSACLEFYLEGIKSPAAANYMGKLKGAYGDDLPARYLAISALINFPEDKKTVHQDLQIIKDRYVLPDALNRISEKYIGDAKILEMLYDTTE